MALHDIAKMTTATTGTGTITLGSAVSGYLSFVGAGAVNAEVVSYGIQDGANSEVGHGTYTSSGTTLSRTVLQSTNGGSAINLSGSAVVFLTALAEDLITTALLNTALPSATTSQLYKGTGAAGTAAAATAGTDYSPANIPLNSQSANYTTVLADAGKCIYHPAADTNARTFTIDSNANVAYPIGTVLTFSNNFSTTVNVTIAITTDTMRLVPAGTTGNRTLAAGGLATALKVTSTEWQISGSGLT